MTKKENNVGIVIRRLSLACFLATMGVFFISNDVRGQRVSESLLSPDARIQFDFVKASDADSSFTYTVKYNGRNVINESGLAIDLDNHLFEWALAIKNRPDVNWMKGLVFKSAIRRSVDTTWLQAFGERNKVHDQYNELILSFEQKANPDYSMEIHVRAFNEGVAFRYHFPDNPTGVYYRIVGERSEFKFPNGTLAWFEPWAQGPYSCLPLSNWPGESERPLTLQVTNGLYVCLGEAGLVDFARAKYKLSDTDDNTLVTSLYESVDMIPRFATPWRVIMVAETPGKLIENNDIFLNLNDASKIANTTWIKPGKIVRDMTLTKEGAVSWINFASEHNMQYVLFDWKWYGPAFTFDSDARKVAIDLDLPSIISYAKQKNVGIWLYVNQQALLKQDFEIFPLYKEWGIAGVKYGFVSVGSHRWTTWLHESIQRAAENELMVNIHDEFRLTGEQRTWPNIVTAEGIRGNEEMPDATHNCILPFTRGIAGMGDYTICYYTPRIKTTHAHQLALSVVTFSPLQTLFWYDKAADYQNEPEIKFFESVPTVWDVTKVVDGQIGEFITVARKSGNDWFIGAITNNSARKIKIPLEFLDQDKKYEAICYEDDKKMKSKTKVRPRAINVSSNKVLEFDLHESGGVAIHIEPVR